MTSASGSNPKISVLLPVYNGEGEICETVDYILCQTFSDFELLLLDDGSTDNTWKVIQDLAKKDSRIRIFHQVNAGLVSSLNRLAKDATGEILIREDCGDFSAPNRYQIQYDMLINNPTVNACVSDYWLLEVDGTAVGIRRMPESHEALTEQVKISNITAHPTFAIRRSVFEEIGGYDESLFCSQDYDILLKLLQVGPVIPINQPLVAVKFNPRGITFKNSRKQAAYAKLIQAKHFGGNEPEFIDYDPLSIEEAEAIYHRTVGKLHLAKGKSENARKHFKAAASYKIDAPLLALAGLSMIPGSIIRLLRRFRNVYDDELTETPFF